MTLKKPHVHPMIQSQFHPYSSVWSQSVLCLLCLLVCCRPLYARKPGVNPKPLPLLTSNQSEGDILDSIVYEDYLTGSSLWSLESKFQYIYDAAGHKLSYAAFAGNPDTGTWQMNFTQL